MKKVLLFLAVIAILCSACGVKIIRHIREEEDTQVTIYRVPLLEKIQYTSGGLLTTNTRYILYFGVFGDVIIKDQVSMDDWLSCDVDDMFTCTVYYNASFPGTGTISDCVLDDSE